MKIAIVGGGFTGLSAAKKLLEAGHQVDLLEKGEYLGGLASSVEIGDTKLEVFYHHIFTSDHEVQELVKELDLNEDLMWLESKMGFFVNEQIFEFGTPISLLKFKPLNIFDKIRFGISVIRLQMLNDWKRLEHITAKEWLLNNAGAKVYKTCWEPLLRTKFGEKHDKISMAWFWGKIKLRGSTRSEAKTKEQLGYLKGSFERLGDRLVEKLKDIGLSIQLNAEISGIHSKGDQVLLSINNIYKKYDKVLVTVPLPLVPNLITDLPKDYLQQIGQIEYTSVICTILIMNRSFSDIYWLNIGDTSIPFGGLIEHTNMVHDSGYNNKHILYISNYTFMSDPLYHSTDKEVMNEYMIHLKKINPSFDESWIEEVKVFRAQFAQPVILCNYSSIKPDFKTPSKGIYIANMSHIYPEDRGMNYAIKTGYKVAEEMLSDI